jgi:hypothetical protein
MWTKVERRKIEMNQLRLCHNGTPCVTILNKQNVIFFLLQSWKTGGQNRFRIGTSRMGEDVEKGRGRVNKYTGYICM